MSPDELRFDERGLIPAVVQEADTGEVLMVAWMDRAALDATLRTGLSHFWSRSRGTLWRKGETSGHTQHVERLYADCDADVLLVQVHQDGVACHTGHRTCFFRALNGDGEVSAPATMLERLEQTIAARKASPVPGSYVAGLLAKGEAAVCRKIGEEATEVIVAALGGEGDQRLVAETADLWFHTLVLLGARGIRIHDVLQELARRSRNTENRDRAPQTTQRPGRPGVAGAALDPEAGS
jgi:phosphoribosyl-ATP pyrophosphohydrolase/phosphoribosyl-AMP cyclohydrolase